MFPFTKTFGSIFKANLVGLMLACAVLALIVVLAAVGCVIYLTAHFANIEPAWIKALFSGFAGLFMGIGGWFMLPALTVLMAGFFQENAIRRVDQVYYPHAGPQQEQPFWHEIRHDLKFTAWALGLNLLVLPLYLLGIGFLVSILLNSYLLGREFFESAAGYHLGKAQARELGRQHKRAVYGGGFVITLMTLLPVLNLFMPLLAVVWMTHVYHHVRKM